MDKDVVVDDDDDDNNNNNNNVMDITDSLTSSQDSSTSSSSSLSIVDIVSLDDGGYTCDDTSQRSVTRQTQTDIFIIDEDEFNDSINRPDDMYFPLINERRLENVLKTLQLHDAQSSITQSTMNLNRANSYKKMPELKKSHSSYTECYNLDSNSNSVELLEDTLPISPKLIASSDTDSTSDTFFTINDGAYPSFGSEPHQQHHDLSSSLPLTPRLQITPCKNDDPKLSMNVHINIVRLSKAEINRWCKRKTPAIFHANEPIKASKRKRITSSTSLETNSSDDYIRFIRNNKRSKNTAFVVAPDETTCDVFNHNPEASQYNELYDEHNTTLSSIASSTSRRNSRRTTSQEIDKAKSAGNKRVVLKIQRGPDGKSKANLIENNHEDTDGKSRHGKKLPNTVVEYELNTETSNDSNSVVCCVPNESNKKQMESDGNKSSTKLKSTKGKVKKPVATNEPKRTPAKRSEKTMQSPRKDLPTKPFKIPRISTNNNTPAVHSTNMKKKKKSPVTGANNNTPKQTDGTQNQTTIRNKKPIQMNLRSSGVSTTTTTTTTTTTATNTTRVTTQLKTCPKSKPANKVLFKSHITKPKPAIQAPKSATVAPPKFQQLPSVVPIEPQKPPTIIVENPLRLTLPDTHKTSKIDLDLFYLINANLQFNNDLNTYKTLSILQLNYNERIDLFNLIRQHKPVNMYELLGLFCDDNSGTSRRISQCPDLANLNLNNSFNDETKCFNMLINCFNYASINELYVFYTYICDRLRSTYRSIYPFKDLSAQKNTSTGYQNLCVKIECLYAADDGKEPSVDACINSILHRSKFDRSQNIFSIHTRHTNGNNNKKDLNNNNLKLRNLNELVEDGKLDNDLDNEDTDASSDCYSSSNECDADSGFDDLYPNANIKNYNYDFYKPDYLRKENLNYFKNIRKRIKDEAFCEELQTRRVRNLACYSAHDTYDLLQNKTLNNYSKRKNTVVSDLQSSKSNQGRFSLYRTVPPPTRGSQSKVEIHTPTGISQPGLFKSKFEFYTQKLKMKLRFEDYL